MPTERNRDGSGKFEEEVTEQDILKVFAGTDQPVLTASEIADELPVGDKAVYLRLKEMHDSELVNRKEVGARAVVWWAKVEPAPEPATDEGLDRYRGTLRTQKTAAELVDEAREKDREREERLKDSPDDDRDE